MVDDLNSTAIGEFMHAPQFVLMSKLNSLILSVDDF